MNIIEVSKKENIEKVYEIFIDGKNKGKWKLEEVGVEDFDFFNEEGEPLELIYSISQIIKMEFREVVDWSKVPVDTKVLVSNDGEKWYKRHLYKYEDGKFLAWDNGKTSFTATDVNERFPWEYAKLYQE